MHAYATWPDALQRASDCVALKLTGSAQASEFFGRMSEFPKLAALHLAGGMPDGEGAVLSLPALREVSLVATELGAEVDRLCTLFPGIQSLAIWGRHSRDQALPAAIGSLARLRSLELVSCGISALPDALTELGALRELRIGDCPLREFPLVITRLPALTHLAVRGHFDSLPDALAQLQSLEHLNLSGSLNGGLRGSQATELQPVPAVLGALVALRSLDLGQCGVDDRLEPLARLVGLRSLDISWGQVSDLSSLGALVHLEELSLESCYRLRDLEPLTALPALRKLNMSSNLGIEDLSALSRVPSLEELAMEGCTHVRSLRPVLEHARLRSLRASEAALEAWRARELLREMKSPEQLIEELESDVLEECAAALEHISRQVQLFSPDERSAIFDYFGLECAERHRDDRELVDIDPLDLALQRFGPQLSSALLLEVACMSLDFERSCRATLMATELLAIREDAPAQVAFAQVFHNAYRGGAGQRTAGRGLLDALINTYFPAFLPGPLASLLAGCSTAALRPGRGDTMDVLFVAALSQGDRVDAAAMASLVETFCRYAQDMFDLGQGDRIDSLRSELALVHPEATRAIDHRLAVAERRALLHDRIEAVADAEALSALLRAMLAGEPGHSFAELDGVSGFSARVVEHYRALATPVRLAVLEASWRARARGWDWAQLVLMELEADAAALREAMRSFLAAHPMPEDREHLAHILQLAERLHQRTAPANAEHITQHIRNLQRSIPT